MTTTDVQVDYALTADDLKAMKEARYLLVFWRPDGSEGPVSGIRIGRDVRLEDNPNAERELARIAKHGLWKRSYASEWQIDYTRTIPASLPSQVTMYDGKAGKATFLASSLPYNLSVLSIVKLLKVGDRLGVYFVGSNNSENMRAVHYQRDECYLRVSRNGKLVGEYLMGVEVGPDNTARMVQPA